MDSLTNIRIMVVDSSSKSPIEGITLAVFNSQGHNVFLGGSDKLGVVLLKINTKIPLKYRFTALGYNVKERSLDFSNRVSATIGMTVSSITLQEVKVNGAVITRDADKLRYRVDSKRFLKGADATVVLRDVPLLGVNSQGTVSIKNNPAVVMINGRPANNLQLMALGADKIESIDVVTNPSSVNSATDSKSGGIVNIRLKESNVPQVSGNATLGMGSLSRILNPGFSLNANSKKLFANIYFFSQASRTIGDSRYNVDDLSGLGGSSEHYNDSRSRFKMQNITADLFYDINKNERLSLGLGKYLMDFDIDNSGVDNFYSRGRFSTINSFLEPSVTYQVDAEYKKTFADKTSLVLRYNLRRRQRSKEQNLKTINLLGDTTTLVNNEDIDGQSHVIQLLYRRNFFKDKLKTEMGTTVGQNNSDNIFDTGILTQNPLGSTYNRNLVSLNQFTNAYFLVLRYSYRGYSLRSGLRYEHLVQNYVAADNSFKSLYDNLFPNFVVQKSLGKNVDLIFNYQRKIARPDASILNQNRFQYNNIESFGGNSQVRPELINKFDLNFDFKTPKSFYEIAVFANYSKNPLSYIGSKNGTLITNTYQNIKDLWVYGGDVSIKNDLTEDLSLNTSVFAEQYAFDKTFPQTIYNRKFNTGGNFSMYYSLKKIFSASLTVDYKLIDRSYAYQSYRENNLVAGVSIGKSFLDKKLYASITCTDIFNTSSETRSFFNDTMVNRATFATNRPDIFLFRLSYNFGKNLNIFKSRTSIDKSGEDASFKKQ